MVQRCLRHVMFVVSNSKEEAAATRSQHAAPFQRLRSVTAATGQLDFDRKIFSEGHSCRNSWMLCKEVSLHRPLLSLQNDANRDGVAFSFLAAIA
jgi:hypothetical protein